MAEEFYKLPENPRYSIDDIRKLQDSDPARAETVFNPLIMRILENIAAVHKGATNAVISPRPPAEGPVLWFCSDPAWRPGTPETGLVATAILGDPADADKADATAEVNDVAYPILNATVSQEGGGVVVTIEQP